MSEASGIEGDIAIGAYCLWEAAGRPEGRAMDHWLEAEARVRAERVAGKDAAGETLQGSAGRLAVGRRVRYGLVLRS